MKYSAILTTLCAAPLALAGILKAEVVPRNDNGMSIGNSHGSKNSGSSGSSGSSVVIQETVINEVIVIWVNVGGGAATSTVNTVSSVSSAAGSIKTHSVCESL